MTELQIAQRKKDHLSFALSRDAQIGDPGFNKYRFMHNSLPEIDFNKIDITTTFLDKKVNYPFFISCMTGGVEEGQKLNRNLASAAQQYKIAFGVGSQRAAIVHPELKNLFAVRKYAPDIPVLANVGLVQLNYGFGLDEVKKVIDMVKADALVFHINPIQELIQPEGDRNFAGLVNKLAKILPRLPVPVIAKEVGFGLSEDVINRLQAIGVTMFDTAGWGGTNWAFVEGARRNGFAGIGKIFENWGIPTAESIVMADKVRKEKQVKGMVVLGSGGIRSGLDIAKALALGADLAGIAAPFAQAALESRESVGTFIEKLGYELKIAMMGVGADSVVKLKNTPLYRV